MTATFFTTPMVVQPLDRTSTSDEMGVGLRVPANDGGEFMYIQAISTVQQYDAVTVLEANTVAPLTTANASVSKQVAFAQVSIASSSYGWVQLSGRPRVKLAANCGDSVILFTTATGGVLDDATISEALVAGITSVVTISNATAITCVVPAGGCYIHPFANPA